MGGRWQLWGRGSSGGGGGASLTLLPESYGFIASGLEKGSMRRASNDSSALNTRHSVAGA